MYSKSVNTEMPMDPIQPGPAHNEQPGQNQPREGERKQAKTKDELRAELKQKTIEASDWQWAYNITEGILRGDPRWYGIPEKFRDGRPILAARLARQLMERCMSAGVIEKTSYRGWMFKVGEADPARKLIDWLKLKPWRTLRWDGRLWTIRDEAMSREITTENLDGTLRSEAWVKFSCA